MTEDKLASVAKAIKHLIEKAERNLERAKEREDWAKILEVESYKSGLETGLVLVQDIRTQQ